MKNKILNLIIIIAILISFSIKSYAVVISDEERIRILTDTTVGYTYNDKEKTRYFVLKYGDYYVYTLNSDNQIIYAILDNCVKQNDEKLKAVLRNGYPNKTYQQLGCQNYVEAYIATQEAIYYTLEGKDISLYKSEDAAGERILNALKSIIKKSNTEIIKVTPKTEKWQEYDNEHKFKEYEIKADATIIFGKISINVGNECVILGNDNTNKEMFNSNDTFKIVVPKNLEQEISLKLSGNINSSEVYLCETPTNADKKYLISESVIEDVQKNVDITVRNQASVDITNIDEENKAINGNIFQLLNSDYGVIKNELVTDENGKIKISLDNGLYYLKQTKCNSEYEINKSLIQIRIQEEKGIKINVTNTKAKNQESVNTSQEINVSEETKNIFENNIKEVSNIKIENINKEIINTVNETNLHHTNYFVNNINRKNVLNIEKENMYQNYISEQYNTISKVEDESNILNMSREDYINYIDLIKANSAKIPILPIASK